MSHGRNKSLLLFDKPFLLNVITIDVKTGCFFTNKLIVHVGTPNLCKNNIPANDKLF